MTNTRWRIDQDHDVRVASWRVAELIYGEDDGSMERDEVECQIQEVIARSFDFTTVNDGPERPAACRAAAEAAVMDGDIEDVLDAAMPRRDEERQS